MTSGEQNRKLTGMVLEALRHRRYCAGNDNPALGQAIMYVDAILLSWARTQAADDFDVENIVADVGLKMLGLFATFRGTTGGEFYDCMETIVKRRIARMRRLLEAKEKGCLRRAFSLERDAKAGQLAEGLASCEPSPEVAAEIRENAQRVRLALRGLSVDQLRVVRLHAIDGRSMREIAAKFGHVPSWAQGVWDTAASEMRRRLMRLRRVSRRPLVSANVAGD
jgi:RNA polymerase sigma factor (sigma-70 family)